MQKKQTSTSSSTVSTPSDQESTSHERDTELLDQIDATLEEIDEVLETSGALAEAQARAEYREKLLGWAKNQRRLGPTHTVQEFLAEVLPCQC